MASISESNRQFTGFGGFAGLRVHLGIAVVTFCAVWIDQFISPPLASEVEGLNGAGVVLALLIAYGERHWPGMFVGAALGALSLQTHIEGWLHFDPNYALLVLAYTGQAYLGARWLRALFGEPINLAGPRAGLLFVLIAGPVWAAITPLAGVILLHAPAGDTTMSLADTWLKWWQHDLVDTSLALPLIVLFPSVRPSAIRWKGYPVPRLGVLAFSALIVSVSVTVMAWDFAGRSVAEQYRTQFRNSVGEATQALLRRIQFYQIGLQGGEGLFEASGTVDAGEWHRFVDALHVDQLMPGANGVGFIQPVRRADLPQFLAGIEAEGAPLIVIHPETKNEELFVNKYIEPIGPNAAARGLSIDFEPRRREAAIEARDSGNATMTRKITLVQDEKSGAGFLILQPVYEYGKSLRTVAERRKAFLGWVYIPLIAEKLAEPLAVAYDSMLDFSLYDGPGATPEQLIYSSPGQAPNRPALFEYRTQMVAYGATWTAVWRSSPQFEAGVLQGAGATSVLLAGVAFTLLLMVFLTSQARKEEEVQHKVAEQTRELTARNRENRAILDTSFVKILLLDGRGSLLMVNEATVQLFGYSHAELLHKPISILLGDQLDGFLKLWRDGDDETPVFQGELRGETSSGEGLILEVKIGGWLTENGCRRYTVVMRNVTAHKQMEQLLSQTERRLDVALTGANIGVFDVDLETGKSVVSNTWKKLYGIPPEAEIDAQAEFLRRIHPDDRDLVEKNDRDCIEGRVGHSMTEYRIRSGTSGWRWMYSDAVVGERDADGRALRLIGVQMDITELVEVRQNLHVSEERLRLAIEQAPIGMAITNQVGEFIQVNQAFVEFFGSSQQALMECGLFCLLTGLGRQDLAADIDDLDTTRSRRLHAQIEVRHAGGGEVAGILNAAVLRTAEASKHNLVIQIQDVTEQRRLDRAKNEFVATVSHELRTPLTSIKGAIGLMLNPGFDDFSEKSRRLLSIAQTNTERLRSLVEDILDMEKISLGEMNFDIASADLVQLVTASIEANRVFAGKFGVEYRLDHAKYHSPALIDPKRFQQVMTNLLSNAAKFATPGTAVEVRVETIGAQDIIFVINAGQGIRPEDRDKIFQPFSQVDSSSTRAQGGSGLGLHIAAKIVERMGGSIGFESVPDKITTFWFTVPVDISAKVPQALSLPKVAGSRA